MRTQLAVAVLALSLAGCATTAQKQAEAVKAAKADPTPAVVVQTAKPAVAPAAPSASDPAPAGAKAPSAMSSLQPFKKFGKGAGEGVAKEYKPRSKEQLAALLRDKKLAAKEMRVSCDVLVRQMAEAHPGLPFEGCEGAAAAIAGDANFSIVPCKDGMFLKDNLLTVTDAKGASWGVWHRKCQPKEQVLVYKGQPLMSTTCLNVAIPVVTQQAAAPATAADTAQRATPPKVHAFSQYALQINFMADRPNGFWQQKYEDAKSQREKNLTRDDINKKGMLPYYEVFTKAPFGEMLAERKARPLDGRFLVRFLKKEPVLDIRPGDSSAERAQKYNAYLKQFQQPAQGNVLISQWVSTGNRGWVIIPITVALEEFEAVLIQSDNVGSVLEPVIAVHRYEFANQSNPIHVWEVRNE